MDRKLGIVLIILGFAVSVNPYWVIFAIPIFSFGAILLWTTKRTIFHKIFWTIIPLLLWYPAMNLFLYANSEIGQLNAQKIDFIFSNNFYGRVVIVDGISCGQDILKKDGREQLIIPDNGILLYKEKIKSGYTDYNYYIDSNSPNKTSIPTLADYMFWEDSKNKPSNNLTGVFPGEMGSKSNFITGTNYHYLALTVTSKDSLETFREFKYLKAFETSVDNFVAKCR